ncbi:MAG TPA: hypothetical protein VLE47_02035, partial [Candidatus Saccharimonadales bacterium]|nr:hypothetical protein [Candidatus Saccharimonadales bacterium]
MRRLLSLWNNLSLQTKLGLAFTLLLLFSVPATVLSVNMIKDNRARAAGLVLGDTRYPDPLVSWNRATNFRVEVCLNTSQRGGAYCNANNFPGSNNQISYNSLNGYTYYWFVDLQDYNGAWQQYLTGSYTNNCFNAGGTPQQTCGHTIGWPQPTFDTQAVYAGSALRNACDGFVASCVSSVKDFYPNQQVQYIDLPANIGIDVYIKTGNILFLVLKNLNTGSVAVTSKPTLTIPTFGQQNVSTTNTNFAWTAVPGASYYALWVSTSNDFSNAGFWYKNVQANACTATDCLSSWTNGAWSIHNGNVGPYPPPPASLAKSTTYYWLVWACSSTSCPLPGLATPSNFTTEAAVAQPSVGGLQDSDSPSIPPGVWGTTHKFDWSGANASSFVV